MVDGIMFKDADADSIYAIMLCLISSPVSLWTPAVRSYARGRWTRLRSTCGKYHLSLERHRSVCD